MDFFKKKKTLENGTSSKFVVECDWDSKISQNVHHLIFWKKNKWSFGEKTLFFHFFKTSKCINYSVECNRISKTSQNFQKLGFFKKRRFFDRKFDCI